MAKPLLSIGIIFKNDIRSIERCLKALQPLRDAIPCELVMADTGSDDGSRAVAEQYADILFDFPWIDDFAAARNAVLDRCSGVWHLSVDTDEYLDENISELLYFLTSSETRKKIVGVVKVRDYEDYEMDGDYSDFMAFRLLRMSTGVRYEGIIHEHFAFKGEVSATNLPHTLLHHDGYVELSQNTEIGRSKRERNTRLIQASLEKAPEDLSLWMQLIETLINAPDKSEHVKAIRKALPLIQEKKPGWDKAGPPILRYAVYAAESQKLPEWDEWLKMAEEWFPESMFTRLDVEYCAFAHAWNKNADDREEAIRRGERFLKALEDQRGGADPMAQMYSTLQALKPDKECTVKFSLVIAYCQKDQLERAFELIESIDYSRLDGNQMKNLSRSLQIIHFQSVLDTAPVIAAMWAVATDAKQPAEKTAVWRQAMLKAADEAFLTKRREAENRDEKFVRNACTLFLPLEGKCELGRAAAVLETEDASVLEEKLAAVEKWGEFPIQALAHALEHGAAFSLPGKPLKLEEMDTLAARLAAEKGTLLRLALAAEVTPDDPQRLCWSRALVLAAVQAFDWGAEAPDVAQGLSLARKFAEVERQFLPLCYSPQALTEEGIFLLPSLHRFGWYCARAFDALDAGDGLGYVRLLRAGLEASHEQKRMVEFLTEHTPELQAPAPTPELLALAEQVRTFLAAFPPDDPAVQQLKASEEYQKVAYLIER